MAIKRQRPLSAATIKADREALRALKELADYAPSDPALTVEALSALEEKLCEAEEAEVLAAQALAAARDARNAAEQALHTTTIQGLGLKNGDRRRPVRRTTPSA